MPCLAAPKLPYPTVALSLLLPTLTFSPPAIGVSFCCQLETPPIPGFPIIIPLGLISGIAVILQPAMALIMTAIDLLNSILDQISVDCPLD